MSDNEAESLETLWLKFRDALLKGTLAPEQVSDLRLLFYGGAKAALHAIFRDGMAGPQSFGFAVVLDRLTKVRAELNAMTPEVDARSMDDSRPFCSPRVATTAGGDDPEYTEADVERANAFIRLQAKMEADGEDDEDDLVLATEFAKVRAEARDAALEDGAAELDSLGVHGYAGSLREMKSKP